MKVDFNNLRRQACNQYDVLCRKLNDARLEKPYTGWLDGYGEVKRSTIIIAPEQLEEVMNNLRMMIGTIACCYEENDPEIANVYEELYPEDSEKRMLEFNSE